MRISRPGNAISIPSLREPGIKRLDLFYLALGSTYADDRRPGTVAIMFVDIGGKGKNMQNGEE